MLKKFFVQILHTGPNMWIVNHFPWWAIGLEQCVCVDIKEGKKFWHNKIRKSTKITSFLGGDDTSTTPIYPIQPQWVENLIYIGREIIGVEYLKDKDEDLTEVIK